MSDPVYTVVIRDNQSQPGRVREQDLTAVEGVDMSQTQLNPTNSPKSSESTLHLSFPITTPDLFIKKKMQVWAGWRDRDTLVWLPGPTPVYGGYIRVVKEWTWGAEKKMELALDDFNILLAGTPLLGWPTFYPGGSRLGYPPGYSVTAWLAGRRGPAPYDGVLRAHLGHGFRFDGIDPIFDTIKFTAEVLPGIPMVTPGESSVRGHTDFVQLSDLVKVIADAAYYAWAGQPHGREELQVGYWVGAVPDGTRIVPQFCLRNVADQDAPADLTVSDEPNEAAGEYYMIHPFVHEEDSSEIMGRVVVKGRGGDETLAGTVLTPDLLVYADYTNPEHKDYAPTDYQLTPGWCFKIVDDPRIHTKATAQRVAEVIESKLWGAQGAIEFAVDVPINEADPGFTPQIGRGTRIRVRDANEALDRVYTVSESTPAHGDELGLNRYHVRIGGARKTIDDILKGGLIEQWLILEDLDYKTDRLSQNRALPGMPGSAPLGAAPVHSDENAITPQYVGAAALRTYAPTQLPTDAQGNPIPIPRGARTDIEQGYGPGKVLKAWRADDGNAHPVFYSMEFQAAGYRKITWPYDVRGVRVKYSGTGTISFTDRDGTALTVPLVSSPGTPGRIFVSADTLNPPAGAVILPDMVLIVLATGVGTTPATAVSLVIGEFDG